MTGRCPWGCYPDRLEDCMCERDRAKYGRTFTVDGVRVDPGAAMVRMDADAFNTNRRED